MAAAARTGSRRTPRAVVCIASWPRRRAAGREGGAIARTCTAARDWRPPSSGASGREPELDAGERRFLDASRAASERARRRACGRARGRGRRCSSWRSSRPCSRWRAATAPAAQATAADAQRLGAQALNEPTLDRSLLLARQGVALDDTPGTRDSLLDVLQPQSGRRRRDAR